jgi:para-aminobenzoate synthetase
MGKTLLIDNYDSFTYNLAQLIAKATGEWPTIIRNDETTWDALCQEGFERIVISPGPGRPQCREDLGLSADAMEHATVPIFGVCLGHQLIGHFFGATVGIAVEPVHGRMSAVKHVERNLFEDISNPFEATRYHSLAVTNLPAELEPIAWTEDGTLMALRHVSRPIWGVQFHPESICTEYGEKLIQNFFRLSQKFCESPVVQPDVVSAETQRATTRDWESMQVHVRRYRDSKLLPSDLFQALFGDKSDSFWLDSSRPNHTNARFSYFGDASGPYSEILEYESLARRLVITSQEGSIQSSENIFTYMEHQLAARKKPVLDNCPFDFNGGYVGYFGYELKGELQGEYAHQARTPDACWIFADRLIAYDHQEQEYWLLCLDASTGLSIENERWLEQIVQALHSSAPAIAPSLNDKSNANRLRNISWRHAPDQYMDKIRRAKELIRQGETYEVCLTNELTGELDAEALPIYMNLRTVNAVPFGAYLQFGSLRVLCASPELYIEVTRDGDVESKPIKGTAPRHNDPIEDHRIMEKLAHSVKDRSENLMIVDLVRNDLNRCCVVGSVHVPKIFGIESFATVHQLVSTIRGKLMSDGATVDCVRQSFPGGSMTGAPKVRTMSILDQLEEGARGIYSGSLGYIALCGSAKLNIVIRTIVMKGNHISIGSGGAIVALSDPQEELDEVLLKAKAQIRVLEKCGLNLDTEASPARDEKIPEFAASK